MARRTITLREQDDPAQNGEQEVISQVVSQRKRPEIGRFLLQVDRQTKSSYQTGEAAEEAGKIIKKGHPVVQVAVYDAVESVHKIVEL
jgi:formylglycine-generating enzyme required for sulfatase activity